VGTTFGDRGATSSPANLVEQLTSLATALNDESAISRGLAQITKRAGNAYAEWQFAGAVGFLDGLDRRGVSLREFAARTSASLKSTLDQLDPLLEHARAMVNPDAAIRNPQSQMLLAIRLLGRGTPNQDADLNRLAALLNAQVPTTIQQAALNGLKQTKGAKIGETLVSGWRGYGPNTRQEVMNLLFSRTEWIQELLAAIEAGKISTGELGLPQQQKILFHSQPAIRARAAKLFSAMNADRQEILKQYDVVKTLTGNASKGAALFRQHCASCHKFKDEGNNVGPDLGSVADKSVPALLVAILNPNQAVDAAYVNYFLETRNGRELSGIIAAETPNSVTIRATGGIEEIVLRSDLKELRSSGLSLMPEGFETALKPQDMADLIAHVLAR
jgi:putative heme-binding domain-containing protein